MVQVFSYFQRKTLLTQIKESKERQFLEEWKNLLHWVNVENLKELIDSGYLQLAITDIYAALSDFDQLDAVNFFSLKLKIIENMQWILIKKALNIF